MKNKIKAFITTNIGWKILSLLLGIAVWAFLSNEYDPVTTKNISIPVVYNNEDLLLENEKLVLLSAPETVQITVSTRTSRRSKATAELFVCTADLCDHSGGDLSSQRVHISVSQVGGNDIVLDWNYNKNDPNITVSMDKYIEKTFTVELLTEDELAENLFFENTASFTPQTVTVSGPESRFSSVASVKGLVNLNELSENGGGSFSKEIELRLYDANGNVITNTDGLTMSTTTAVLNATVSRVQSVNIIVDGTIGAPAAGYRYVSCTVDPSSITVHGLKSIVADLTEIHIPANAIDITGISAATIYSVSITPYLPDNVTLSNAAYATVNVIVDVEQLQTENFRVSSENIQLTNTEEGVEYKVESELLNIRVKGFREDLDQLSLDSFRLSADVSELTEGTHRVKVKVAELSGYTIDNANSLYATIKVIYPETTESTEDSSETDESESTDDTDASEESENTSTDASSEASEEDPTEIPESSAESSEAETTEESGAETEETTEPEESVSDND